MEWKKNDPSADAFLRERFQPCFIWKKFALEHKKNTLLPFLQVREKEKPLLFPRYPIFNREDYSIYRAFLCHIHPYCPTKAKKKHRRQSIFLTYISFLYFCVYILELCTDMNSSCFPSLTKRPQIWITLNGLSSMKYKLSLAWINNEKGKIQRFSAILSLLKNAQASKVSLMLQEA